MKTAALLLGTAIVIVAVVMGWKWRSRSSVQASAFDNSAAFVQISDKGVEITASRRQSPRPSDAAQLVKHLRDLQLPDGSPVGIVVFGSTPVADPQAVKSQLIESGFQVTGVMRIEFDTLPSGNR